MSHYIQNARLLNTHQVPRFSCAPGPIDLPKFAAQNLPAEGHPLSYPCFALHIINGLSFAGNTMLTDPQCMTGLCPSPEVRATLFWTYNKLILPLYMIMALMTAILRASHWIVLPENVFPYPRDAKPCLQSRNLEMSL
jgi:hypothetical protein